MSSAIEETTLPGDLPGVKLTSPKGTAEVYRHGAHVTSWKTETGEELIFLSTDVRARSNAPPPPLPPTSGRRAIPRRLFALAPLTPGLIPLSPRAASPPPFRAHQVVFKPPKAIRGGIPICFPQFSDLGPLDAQHGFARNERWDIVAQTSDSVTMRLASTPESLARWPHAFEATYAVALEADGGLATTLEVKNLGAEPMRFTTALHTYFRVGSVAGAKVTGLRGVKYLDQLDGSKSGLTDKDGLVGWERKTEEAEAVTFEREVDRVYLGAPSRGVAIVDAARGAEVTLATENLPDAVVWNPWIDKSKATGDLGDEDYKAFVCVEAAAVERPAEVKPGETWRCKQVLARNAA